MSVLERLSRIQLPLNRVEVLGWFRGGVRVCAWVGATDEDVRSAVMESFGFDPGSFMGMDSGECGWYQGERRHFTVRQP